VQVEPRSSGGGGWGGEVAKISAVYYYSLGWNAMKWNKTNMDFHGSVDGKHGSNGSEETVAD